MNEVPIILAHIAITSEMMQLLTAQEAQGKTTWNKEEIIKISSQGLAAFLEHLKAEEEVKKMDKTTK